MIFLDTSWLVKRLVDERGAADVRRIIAAHDVLVVSEIASVEFHSAMQRRRREGTLSARLATALSAEFRDEWPTLTRVAVASAVLSVAIELLARHPLRTLDAIQLASAKVVMARSPETLYFGSADARLNAAAVAEAFALPVE